MCGSVVFKFTVNDNSMSPITSNRQGSGIKI